MHRDPLESYDALIKTGTDEELTRAIIKIIDSSYKERLENLITKADFKQEITEVKTEIKVITLRLDALERNLSNSIAKIYNLSKFILALMIIPIVLKAFELFPPEFLK